MVALPTVLQELSPAERILLAEDLWDSVAASEPPEVTDGQKAELDRRLATYEEKPGGSSWADVKKRLLTRQ